MSAKLIICYLLLLLLAKMVTKYRLHALQVKTLWLLANLFVISRYRISRLGVAKCPAVVTFDRAKPVLPLV